MQERLRSSLLTLLLTASPAATAAPAAQDVPVAEKLTIVLVNVESLQTHEVLRAGDALPNFRYLQSLGTWYTEGRGVLPSHDLAGQAALLTGRYPEENGIAGGMTWRAAGKSPPRLLNRPTDLRAPTLFRIIRRHCPALDTAGVLAQSDAHQLFSSCGEDGQQCSPYSASPRLDFQPKQHAAFEASRGHVPDPVVTAAARAFLPGANLLVLGYADLDSAGHAGAPEAETGIVPGRAFALAQLDTQLGLLIADLQRSNRWQQTILFLASTHGMSWAGPDQSVHVADAIPPGGRDHFLLLGEGGLQSLYLRKRNDADAWATALHLVETLRQQTGIQGAWFTSLHSSLLELRTGTELAPLLLPRSLRARSPLLGDVVLAAGPGYRLLADPPGGQPAGGHHGGLASLRTTLLVSGGAPFLRPQLVTAPGHLMDDSGRVDPLERLPDQPEVVDIAPTIAWLLGLADRPEGQAQSTPGNVLPAFSGRILHEAFELPAVRPLGRCGLP